MNSEEISVDAMQENIAAGSAIAVVDATAPPCLWHQRWWAVAAGAAVYEPVQDAAQVSKLDDLLARKRASSSTGNSS